MTLRLLTEPHLEFLCSKAGCTGPSESTHVKMPHCWKSHVAAHIYNACIYFAGLNKSTALRSLKMALFGGDFVCKIYKYKHWGLSYCPFIGGDSVLLNHCLLILLPLVFFVFSNCF